MQKTASPPNARKIGKRELAVSWRRALTPCPQSNRLFGNARRATPGCRRKQLPRRAPEGHVVRIMEHHGPPQRATPIQCAFRNLSRIVLAPISSERKKSTMLGRTVAMVMIFLVAGCGAMRQQQQVTIVRDAQAGLQAIADRCMERMQSDHDLDPIRNKIEVFRLGLAGAPPPGMLVDQSHPTSHEKVAIAKWQGVREACAQEQMRYGLMLTLPPNLQPLRDKLVLTGRRTNERTGLLAAGLYDGRLTYGQFAAERMKNTDDMVASLAGTASPADGVSTSNSCVPGQPCVCNTSGCYPSPKSSVIASAISTGCRR